VTRLDLGQMPHRRSTMWAVLRCQRDASPSPSPSPETETETETGTILDMTDSRTHPWLIDRPHVPQQLPDQHQRAPPAPPRPACLVSTSVLSPGPSALWSDFSQSSRSSYTLSSRTSPGLYYTEPSVRRASPRPIRGVRAARDLTRVDHQHEIMSPKPALCTLCKLCTHL
jgi:hypothetical protein